ncbi:helix-turn-helix domain-containing protein [Pedobacter sp. AW1-32]|uniref:helix-turn-helix domain-containing protein n=1 Tax=Pedobacter sp. AW1-32 TaxID=3383026 RepID=UPI003FEF6896
MPLRFKSIADFHRFRGLPKPAHPLISVFNVEQIKYLQLDEPVSLMFDFYAIALKRHFNIKMKYGQQSYDFDEGLMTFMSPGQIFGIEFNPAERLKQSGWMLFIHPDFLWNTALATQIKKYEYFDYAVNEALHLSEKEEETIISLMQNIDQEYRSNMDTFSQSVIIAQIELLLTYSERFYHRQFITRKISNHQILHRLEKLLSDHFSQITLTAEGLPTVQQVANQLNVSPNYLSGLLKMLTGKSTQQHIHDKLIETAKQQLSSTSLSVSEIAYQLGFEHPQSFSKLFKTKTNLSPIDFRESFG